MRAVAAVPCPVVVPARAAARRGLERCGRERGRFARTLFSSPGTIARPSLCSTSLTATSSRTWLLGALSRALAAALRAAAAALRVLGRGAARAGSRRCACSVAALRVLGRGEWKSLRDGG
jgi:hypothetical protein